MKTLLILSILALVLPAGNAAGAALKNGAAPGQETVVEEKAQSPEEIAAAFQESFDEGIAALESGEHKKGIAAFEMCLELDPKNGVCAYNITCGYALQKEIDLAFEWFAKAAEWGYGNSAANIEHAEKTDADLASLRRDERFGKTIDGMKTSLAKTEKLAKEEWQSAEIYLPEALAEEEQVGALVVLHDDGGRKSSVISAWKARADELGVMLVAPSGKFMAGAKLEDGMAWFTDAKEFQARPWKFEETVDAALKEANEKKPLDKSRTVIVGEGQGGIIAFNAAVRASRIYSGVVVVDGLPLVNLVRDHMENAASSGIKMRWVANPKALWGVPTKESQTTFGGLSHALRQTKLDVKIEPYTPGEVAGEERDAATQMIVKDLLKQVPVEAGAGK